MMSQEANRVNGGDSQNLNGGGGGGASESSRGSRSKKRQSQGGHKNSLMDMFTMHQESIGNWADTANEAAVQHQQSTTNHPGRVNEQYSSGGDQAAVVLAGARKTEFSSHRSPMRTHEHATHSRDAAHLAALPLREPYECKVANINYKSTDEDLFYFFGGEHSVLNVRSDDAMTGRRGVAIVSFKTREALANALSLDLSELLSRPLKISLYDPSQPRMHDHGGHRRGNNSSYHQHAGGYNTLPHPRRLPHAPMHSSYHAGGGGGGVGGDGGGVGGAAPPAYRNRDNRRYNNYDDRNSYQGNKGSTQMYNRFSNRSFDNNYGMVQRPPYNNDNHAGYQSYNHGYDDARRGDGRMRTESVRSNVSNATDVVERQERQKLQLKPRTKPLQNNSEDLPARPASIFGQAKPVDTYEKERKVEERLRLEEEAFKATTRQLLEEGGNKTGTRQRSRKSSTNDTSSIHPPPSLIHGQVTILKAPHDVTEERKENDAPIQTGMPPPLLSNVDSADSVAAAVDMTRSLPPPLPLLDAHIAVRRGSNASVPSKITASERPFDDDYGSGTLSRARNTTYNRTFTRSRDSYRAQSANNKQSNQGKRGKGRTSRGSGSGGNQGVVRNNENETVVLSHEENRSAAGKEKVECVQDVKHVEQRSVNPEHSRTRELTEQKKVELSKLTAEFQPKTQTSHSHSSKKERKKQAKEMLKIEAKQFTFSSENKFAALGETND